MTREEAWTRARERTGRLVRWVLGEPAVPTRPVRRARSTPAARPAARAPAPPPPAAPVVSAPVITVPPVTVLPFRPASPRRRALRRAAVFDLFRASDLGPPPRLIWPLVDGDDDVGAAVERFLALIGAGASDGVLDRVLRAESGLARMGPVEAERVRVSLLSGDRTRVADALAQAQAVTPAGVAEHWPAELLPHGARSAVRDHPASERLAQLLDDHARLRETLLTAWPDGAGERDSERLRDAFALFEDAEAGVLDLIATRADPSAEIARMAAANAWLRAILGQDHAPAASTETGAGIEAAASRAEALACWRTLRWRHHPDRPGLTPEQAEEEARVSALLDRALSRWESAHPFTGSAQA